MAEEDAKAEKEACYRAGCIKSFSMPGYLTGLTEIRCIESPRRERRRGNKERERERERECP